MGSVTGSWSTTGAAISVGSKHAYSKSWSAAPPACTEVGLPNDVNSARSAARRRARRSASRLTRPTRDKPNGAQRVPCTPMSVLFADQPHQRLVIGCEQFFDARLVHIGDHDLADVLLHIAEDAVR